MLVCGDSRRSWDVTVQANPRAVLDSEQGDVDVPVSINGDIDPVAKGVATQDTTQATKRKHAQGSTTAFKRKRSQDAIGVATHKETQKAKTRSSKAKASKKALVSSSAPPRATRSTSKVQEAPSAPKTSSRSPRAATKMLATPSYPRYDSEKAKYDNFFSDESLALWDYVCKRPFLVEHFIDDQSYAEFGMVTFLKEYKLYKVASFAKGFRPVLVHEFFSNLSSHVSDSTSGWYHQVYVRGQMVPFSPEVINKILGRSVGLKSSAFLEDFPTDFDLISYEITGKKVVSWPNDSRFPASSLTLKYYVLYKIAMNNWLSSAHTTSVFKIWRLYCLLLDGVFLLI